MTTTPEYHNYLVKTAKDTWRSELDSLEYSDDGYELIHIPHGQGKYIIPEGVRSINLKGFHFLGSVWRVELPSTLEKIGEIAPLYDCQEIINHSPNFIFENGVLYNADKTELIMVFERAIESDDFTAETVVKIRDFAFSSCDNLEIIELPESVREIGSHAFYAMQSLQSVSIPDGVTTIRESTFALCPELTHIDLPDTVTAIEPDAFLYCEKLTECDYFLRHPELQMHLWKSGSEKLITSFAHSVLF
ncbi:MAG: leucine-rich repeat domain-containing protein [Rikenellaceae bacterium]